MLFIQQCSQKPPAKPFPLHHSHPAFCITGWWATAQQPGWLYWGRNHASRAGRGHQEIVEGWWSASLLRQSFRVSAQWFSILVRLIGKEEGWCLSNLAREISLSLKYHTLKAGDPQTKFNASEIICQLPSLCITLHKLLQPTKIKTKFKTEVLLTPFS